MVATLPTTRLDDLIACPHCDSLYRYRSVPAGETARCTHCHAVLFAPRRGAIALVVSLAAGALVLMIAAISFPFIRIETQGLSNNASVIDAVAAFAETSGPMAPLSFMMGALIVVLPAARLGGLIYALGPLVTGHAPRRNATRVFRMSMRLRPWAMAEIFILGVGVALVKIASLAQVHFGPAFWAFAALVILMAAQDVFMCERSIWRILQPR